MKTIAAALIVVLSALAQPAGAEPLPSYATALGAASVRGVIVDFDGASALRLRDERGYVDAVVLHRGTIVTPVGQQLTLGMLVVVTGVAAGATFEANAIETAVTDERSSSGDDGSAWQGYDRYGCTNAPAPPVHRGPSAKRTWRFDNRC